MTAPKPSVLFVTWDGPQSSYLEGLFLPILRELRKEGYTFHVLQFSWGDPALTRRMELVSRSAGVQYSHVKVLRKPLLLGSLVAALVGALRIRRLIKTQKIDILMPRSVMPALASLMALRLCPPVNLLFDADGLPIDERIDFAGASADAVFIRVLRDIESLAVRRANAVITRSLSANFVLTARGGSGTSPDKFFTVVNCRDEAHFRPCTAMQRNRIRSELGVPLTSPLLVFAGSGLSGKYLGARMLDLFSLVLKREPRARLLLLTTSVKEAQSLLASASEATTRNCHVLCASYEEMPAYLASCDVALSLIQATFSMKAAAAVKVGEYLLCGLPVIATRGVGDTDHALTDGLGFLLKETSETELEQAAQWALSVIGDEAVRARARQIGVEHFGFTSGLKRYRDALVHASGNFQMREANRVVQHD